MKKIADKNQFWAETYGLNIAKTMIIIVMAKIPPGHPSPFIFF